MNDDQEILMGKVFSYTPMKNLQIVEVERFIMKSTYSWLTVEFLQV